MRKFFFFSVTVDNVLKSRCCLQARGQNYMAVLALRLALLKEHSPHLWGEVGIYDARMVYLLLIEHFLCKILSPTKHNGLKTYWHKTDWFKMRFRPCMPRTVVW